MSGWGGGGWGGANHVRCCNHDVLRWVMYFFAPEGVFVVTMDRCWTSLKTWMGVGHSVSDKKSGDRFMCDSIPSLVYQWMWRQTVLPCAPTKFMQELVRLLNRFSDRYSSAN